MNTRPALLVSIMLCAASALAQNAPKILTPEKPPPSRPAFLPVPPAPENPEHFVARARDLLPIVRQHPATADAARHEFRIEGVRLFPTDAFTQESFRLLDEEGGKFNSKLRDRLLDCAATPAPADSQVLLIQVEAGRLPPVPVFLDPDAKELSYLELSIDQPGAPVLLKLSSYDGIAARVTASPRTKLAGVRLDSYYPGVVLGVDPALVSQRARVRSTDRPCALEKFQRSETMRDPPFDNRKTITYKADGSHYQFAIGDPQAVRRTRPTLGNFLDPDMPVPNQHGLVVLAAKKFIRAIPQLIENSGRSLGHETYEILQPFRIPEGLAGAHSVTFLLPAGIAAPSGDLAHSLMFRRAE